MIKPVARTEVRGTGIHADHAADEASSVASPPRHPSFGEALVYWLKLGCISFGGPAGQIAIMHQDLVERRRWISERRFLHALNYCMVLPGPEAQQLATYIGWLMHRTWGGIAAGALFVLPSLILLILLSWIYLAFGHVPAIAGLFYGIKPAVIALVIHAGHRIAKRALKSPWHWGIALAAFVAVALLAVPFPAIVVTAGLIGWIGSRLAPVSFASAPSPASGAAADNRPSVIDDDTPSPPHARFSWARLTRVCAIFLGLWAAVLGALAACFGWDGVLTRMGWFFTKAALLTFGGAYAVLPYVYQGGVEHYQWLSAGQMIDGLALGETTPGPLIMVVAFVGFVGGWTKAIFGPEAVVAAAIVASCVATFFTFLPSFFFILAGGPLIESTHGKLGVTAPLSGITAAVVGVIICLAVFFAQHVLWPHGFAGPFEWPAAIIGVAATVALFRYRTGVITTVVACGVAGLAWTLWQR